MDTLLHDASKFENLGPASQNDDTAKIESQIQRQLLELHKKYLIPVRVYEAIRSIGSQRPRMYFLLKNYKKDVLLRSILSITGSAQHQLAKWPTSFLNPVLQLFFTSFLPNSFTLVKTLRKFSFPTLSPFLCFFDISSVFTNVPLQKTIKIWKNFSGKRKWY